MKSCTKLLYNTIVLCRRTIYMTDRRVLANDLYRLTVSIINNAYLSNRISHEMSSFLLNKISCAMVVSGYISSADSYAFKFQISRTYRGNIIMRPILEKELTDIPSAIILGNYKIPNDAVISCGHAVMNSVGKCGVLLRNMNTGYYYLFAVGKLHPINQDFARRISEV